MTVSQTPYFLATVASANCSRSMSLESLLLLVRRGQDFHNNTSLALRNRRGKAHRVIPG